MFFSANVKSGKQRLSGQGYVGITRSNTSWDFSHTETVLNYLLKAEYFSLKVYPFERANKFNLIHKYEHFSRPFFA